MKLKKIIRKIASDASKDLLDDNIDYIMANLIIIQTDKKLEPQDIASLEILVNLFKIVKENHTDQNKLEEVLYFFLFNNYTWQEKDNGSYNTLSEDYGNILNYISIKMGDKGSSRILYNMSDNILKFLDQIEEITYKE